MTEVHHGPVSGSTWALSRLHTKAVSALVPLPVNLSPLRHPFLKKIYLAIYPQTLPHSVCGPRHIM